MLKPNSNVFDLVHNMFERHIEAKPHYLVACSLWALHTHVFREFEYTPRFALLSPVPESGKSEVLYIFKELSWEPQYFIDPTPASVIRMAGVSTLLIDEADNMLIERSMRSVLNDGHKNSGKVPRVIKNKVVLFPVFGPVAFAAIGTLPATIISRSVVVNMHRNDPTNVKLVRFDIRNTEIAQALLLTKNAIAQWADQVQLSRDPSIPAGLGRTANKWRVLLRSPMHWTGVK